jgi:hypothetical protein
MGDADRIRLIAPRLVAELSRIVPETVTLAAGPSGDVRIGAGDGLNRVLNMAYELATEWPVEWFARQVLDTLQEEIILQVTHTDWPDGGGIPGAEVVDGNLFCWYGSQDRRGLALLPIPLEGV